MLNLIISTIAFIIAAWWLNRYLDDMEIGKGMTRGMLVFVLASVVSWGTGSVVDWTQVKIEGPQPPSLASGDLTQILKAVQQAQAPSQP
ncbi:hypothetical protein ACFDAU_04965 [Sulfuriferula sp. GW1]|uniref:hypothetical protein n=1 Tax=Sulfuriferula sp. GW1 TaxID=3345111 RepID=UPI0039AFAA96